MSGLVCLVGIMPDMVNTDVSERLGEEVSSGRLLSLLLVR